MSQMPITGPTITSHAPAGGWPPIRKSVRMLELEIEHPGWDIRDIMLSYIRSYQTDADVANAIGVSYSGFSSWISKLNIVEEAIAERDMRAVKH